MKFEQLNQHMQSAVQLHQQGQYKKAEILYREAIEHFPDNAEILNLLGTLCSQSDRAEEGASYIQQALNISPDQPHFLLNLGQTQAGLADYDKAIENFKKVLTIQPKSAVTHFNLANCYKFNHQLPTALKYYENAVALDGAKDNYLYNFANTLQALGKYKSAINVYQQSLAINPDNAQAHNNIGIVLAEWDRNDEAFEHYKKAVKLQPDFIDAHHNLFQAYETDGDFDQASQQLSILESLLPNDEYLKLKKALVFPVVLPDKGVAGQLMEKLAKTISQIDSSLMQVKDVARFDLSFPSISVYYGLDDCSIRKKHSVLFEQVIEPLPALPPRSVQAKPNIAFIVTAGHEGVFLKCMAGLIKQLPDTIDVTIVCSLPAGKKILREQLPKQNYLEISKPIDVAAKEIQQVAFDILYYWEVGTDSANYFLPFYKPARIQVGFWGWPTTSGIAAMDYFMSCDALEVEGGEQHYSEKLIKLSRLPTYYYRPPVSEENKKKSDFGFNDDQHIYLCAQNLRKVHPDMDDVFKQILQQDEKAIILLINDKRENITRLLSNRLQKSLAEYFDRLQFMVRMPAEEYLSLVKTADVMLDTFHYTGGANTNYDAFAAGTPVVTLPTKFHRGRYTFAAYKQMDYLKCVAKDEADYVRIALALATDELFLKSASHAVITGCEQLLEDQLAVDAFVESTQNIINSL